MYAKATRYLLSCSRILGIACVIDFCLENTSTCFILFGFWVLGASWVSACAAKCVAICKKLSGFHTSKLHVSPHWNQWPSPRFYARFRQQWKRSKSNTNVSFTLALLWPHGVMAGKYGNDLVWPGWLGPNWIRDQISATSPWFHARNMRTMITDVFKTDSRYSSSMRWVRWTAAATDLFLNTQGMLRCGRPLCPAKISPDRARGNKQRLLPYFPIAFYAIFIAVRL